MAEVELELELDDTEYDFGEEIDVSFTVETDEDLSVRGVRVELLNNGSVVQTMKEEFPSIPRGENEYEFTIPVPRGRPTEDGGRWTVRGIVDIPLWPDKSVSKDVVVCEP